MNDTELKRHLNQLSSAIRAEMGKAQNANEEKFAELALVGIAIVGEMLLDIKRIADAAEKE